MPTRLAQFLMNSNTRRRRTPRIASVVQDGTDTLTIVFDRPMDTSRTTAVFRTVDPVNDVIVEWTDGEWIDDRTFESTDGIIL